MPEPSKGFRKCFYGECLTRDGSYIFCYKLDPMRILHPSTDAQECSGSWMIGHLHGVLTTGSRNGLGRTRFGGFFYVPNSWLTANPCRSRLAGDGGFLWACSSRRSLRPAATDFHCQPSFAAARSVISPRSFNDGAARLRASCKTLAGAVSGLPAWNGGAGAYSSCNCTSSAVS